MSPVNVERGIRASVDYCRRAVAEQWPYTAAVALGELLEAEDAGLVGSEWRDASRADDAETLIASEIYEVERDWRQDVDHLRAILDFGLVGGEEALLVLTLRSNVQCAARFVRDDVRGVLDELDEQLPRLFVRSAAAFRSLRGPQRANLGKRLPGHWWWARSRG